MFEFLRTQLKHKISRKSLAVALDGLDQRFGLNTVEFRQISVQHHFLSAYEFDDSGDHRRRDVFVSRHAWTLAHRFRLRRLCIYKESIFSGRDLISTNKPQSQLRNRCFLLVVWVWIWDALHD
ncbi:MAG: hypothetical protein ETSY1_23845 [Candidatus Entotheonella factor]|uniref:Uncharacterized protein n=1 Tax=Entotheonella factor TaxID=1429438 RepID=W4LGS7_ENTF1|nr:MAG: hypothetical protein ETSY1_23845 [Candidatus Entotheonella factor]